MPAFPLIALGAATSIWTLLQVLTTNTLTLPYWRWVVIPWALLNRNVLVDHASKTYVWREWPTTTTWALYHLGIFLVLFPVVQHLQWFWQVLKQDQISEETSKPKLKTLILPSRTTHSRLFPKKHSFSYSYLLVGIPITSEYRDNSFLSAEVRPANNSKSQSLFSVDAGKYLFRGAHELGLYEKLRAYLLTENEKIEDYAYIYLVTAPRFGGYSFNPVSFWYLCDEKTKLKAMILEVNNTFDERRMYLLRDDPVLENIELIDASTPLNGSSTGKFRQKWPKDFHVSPFNSRKGSYALSAHNPFQTGSDFKIDNTITLSSNKSHSKLIARIFTTSPALDPRELSTWAKVKLLAQWWWVGFFTYPRIVKEAGVLFFKRKLHVWFRPEVRTRSLGRNATDREEVLRKCFEGMLAEAVDNSKFPKILDLRYNGQTKTFESFHIREDSTDTSGMPRTTLDILTPQFFSDVVFENDVGAYVRGMVARPENERTCIISEDTWFHMLFGRLRRKWSWQEKILTFIFRKPKNQIDTYVLYLAPKDLKPQYYSAVWATVLASRFAFGIVELLDGLRVASAWTALWMSLDLILKYIVA